MDDITCENLDILEDADKLSKDSKALLCSENCTCKATKDWLVEYLDNRPISRRYNKNDGPEKV